MTLVSVAKQYFRLMKNVGRFTDGQVEILSWDPDDRVMKINISPNDGLYAGGKYSFSLTLPADFPEISPQVICETTIFHPNIDCTDSEHNVCLSLFDEWTSSNDLQDCIMGLLFLFYNPNLDDPLSPWFDGSVDMDEYEGEVKRLLRGGEHDGFDFPKFIEDEIIMDELRKDEVPTSEEVPKEMNVEANADEGYDSPVNDAKEQTENIKNTILSTPTVCPNFLHRSVSLDNNAALTKPKPELLRSVSECNDTLSVEFPELKFVTPGTLPDELLEAMLREHSENEDSLDSVKNIHFSHDVDYHFIRNRRICPAASSSFDPLTPELSIPLTCVAVVFSNYLLNFLCHRNASVR